MPIKGNKNTLCLKHLRKAEKLTNLIERLKLESELKFTISGGNVFNKFTMRSVKKLDLELTLQCLLRNLKLCPRVANSQ